jgi:AraC-like DNA-binding protein
MPREATTETRPKGNDRERQEPDLARQRGPGELALTERTLQRRLADEGATLSALVDQIRCELAQGHLRHPGLSVTDVAFMLGYSEASAFHRAFRRWTGRSPGDFRKAELGGAEPAG